LKFDGSEHVDHHPLQLSKMKAMNIRERFAVSKILFFLMCCQTESFSLNRLLPNPSTELSLPVKPSLAFIAAWGVASISMVLPAPAFAENALQSTWQTDLQSSLSQPTSDMPRIPLPTGSTSPGIATPSSMPPPWRVQALLSLQNPKSDRPVTSDMLILQVFDQPPSIAAKDSVALGGAKIPVAKLRFPVSVTLGLENAKQPKEWKGLASKQDLWIQASICNENASKFPCGPEEQSYIASGISKLLNQLPNGNEGKVGDGLVIRVPASLILEKLP
jgi:hypothetical protein